MGHKKREIWIVTGSSRFSEVGKWGEEAAESACRDLGESGLVGWRGGRLASLKRPNPLTSVAALKWRITRLFNGAFVGRPRGDLARQGRTANWETLEGQEEGEWGKAQ